MRRRDYVGPGILFVLAVGILVHLYWDRPNPAAWPTCDYFRCVDCSGPASIDPDEPTRWGCRACGYHTWKIAERFRTPIPGELSREELVDAHERAGVSVPDGYSSPATIHWEARKAMGWE